jgi:acyl-CoA reductase-like NAD-dependent aldehyde dehydrogenase
VTPKAFLIGGGWVSSDQSSEIKNPYTHELVGSYFQAGAEQVEQAFQSAHEAFLRNRELTPAARTFRVENMPYGGIKLSGFGREGVKYAMEEMTERKTLIVNYA